MFCFKACFNSNDLFGSNNLCDNMCVRLLALVGADAFQL